MGQNSEMEKDSSIRDHHPEDDQKNEHDKGRDEDKNNGQEASGQQEPVLSLRQLIPIIVMGLLFVVSIGSALFIAPLFISEDLEAFEDRDSLVNPLMLHRHP